MLKELLKHVDDRRRPARQHSLPGSPDVDLLDQFRLDPDVDIRGLPFHAAQVELCRDARLIIPAKF